MYQTLEPTARRKGSFKWFQMADLGGARERVYLHLAITNSNARFWLNLFGSIGAQARQLVIFMIVGR